VVNTDSLSERIYVDNTSKGKSGTFLGGFNAFVTYKGDDFDQASQLNLYHVYNESIQGNIIDFPVVKVTINDPRDPTPYWLISSKRFRKLAAAISAEKN